RLGAGAIVGLEARVAERRVRRRLMIDRDSRRELRERLLEPVHLRERTPGENLRVDVLLVALERLLRADERLAGAARREQQPPRLDARVAVLRIEIDGGAVGAVRLLGARLRRIGVAELPVRVGRRRLALDRVLVLD